MGESPQAIAQEVQGLMAELGFRSRTHAIVYMLAREISPTARDHSPEAAVARELPDREEDEEPSAGTGDAG